MSEDQNFNQLDLAFSLANILKFLVDTIPTLLQKQVGDFSDKAKMYADQAGAYAAKADAAARNAEMALGEIKKLKGESK